MARIKSRGGGGGIHKLLFRLTAPDQCDYSRVWSNCQPQWCFAVRAEVAQPGELCEDAQEAVGALKR